MTNIFYSLRHTWIKLTILVHMLSNTWNSFTRCWDCSIASKYLIIWLLKSLAFSFWKDKKCQHVNGKASCRDVWQNFYFQGAWPENMVMWLQSFFHSVLKLSSNWSPKSSLISFSTCIISLTHSGQPWKFC